MELTSREIDALRRIDQRSSAAKGLGWGLLFSGAVFFVNDTGANWFGRSEVSFSVVFLLTGFFMLCAVYFQTSPNDRLLELLKRYVNNDAEALKQITEASSIGRAT